MTLRVFGYGSLVWRPDLPAVSATPALLPGWARRFWQGSPDHRGTPEAPGRVVTLMPEPDTAVLGVVHEVHPDHAAEVLARLDHRERAGFERRTVTVRLHGGRPVEALAYRATEDNPHFLGPASIQEMAAHIARARGASGSNRQYLFALDEALRELGHLDAHVRDLADAVRALDDDQGFVAS